MVHLLNDIYDKKGEEFVKKLFNLNVVVSEKLSGSTFGFEYDNGEFKFFKKSNGNPLTKIDRVLMKFYEKPIDFFKKIDTEILKQTSSNYRFMFEYFIDNNPNVIVYDTIPKNNLILTHINVTNKNTIITDKKELDKWANEFNVEGPPIIFEGKLNNETKDKVFEFLRMTKTEAIKKFKTSSFTEFLISAIRPDLKKTILNNNLEKRIDGIVFSFENEDNIINAKLIDPIFNEIINKNRDVNAKTDMLPIIFGDMIEFMEIKRNEWQKHAFKKIDFEDRYIEVIIKMFLLFYKKYEKKYENFSLAIPSFMNKDGFKLNTGLIDNVNILKIFVENPKSEDLFKIFLALFRKKKKKVEEFLSPVVIKYQNSIVDDLMNSITKNNSKNESSIPSFSEFCSIYLDEIEVNEQQDVECLILNEDKKIKSANSIITFWQSAFSDHEDYKKNEKLKSINIVIGKFQPINNKHIEFIKELKESNNNKIFLIQINNNNITELQPFDVKLSEELFKKVVESNEKIIKGYTITSSNKLKNIINELSKKYNIESIGVSEKYSDYYKKQIEYNIFEGTLYNIEVCDWKNKEIDNINITSTKIIEAIKNNDYNVFKKLCPKEIWIHFDQLKQATKNKET